MLFAGRLVRLRAFEPEDTAAVAGYLNHPALVGRRHIPWSFSDFLPLAGPQMAAIVQKWGETEKGLVLAVVPQAGGQIVGHAEANWGWDPHNPCVSVVIDPAQQRLGHGSEALALLMSYLFDCTPAHTVTCWIADWNQEGRRLAARHGFRDSGRMRRAGLRQGVAFDLVIMDLLRREWQAAMREGGASHAS
jgi:RimJ/RimL family protein N-acetyltransferase